MNCYELNSVASRSRLFLLYGGLTIYLVILAAGLYANYHAPRLPFQMDWDGKAWTATQSFGGLRQGDALRQIAGKTAHFHTLLVDNAFLSGGDEFWTWMRERAEVYTLLQRSPISIQFEKDGKLEEIVVPLNSHSLEFFRSEVSAHLLVSLVFLVVGASSFSPSPSKQVLVFYLMCLSMSLVYLTNSLSLYSNPVLHPTLFLALNLLNTSQFVLAPALLFHFSLLMPRDRVPRWFPVLLYGSSAVSLILFRPEWHGVLVPLFFLGSLVGIVQGSLSYRGVMQRQQMKWVGIGFLLGVSPWFLINGLPLILTGQRFVSDTIPGTFLISIPICMAVAVKRYRLFDADRFLEGALVYVLTLIILLILDFSLLRLLGFDHPSGEWRLVSIGLLLALYGPVRAWLADWVSRFTHRSRKNDREALRLLTGHLSNSNLSEATEALKMTVQELYSPKSFEVLTQTDLPPGAHLEMTEDPTVVLVLSSDLALRSGALPGKRVYDSKSLAQLDLLTRYCALHLEAGERLREKEQLLGDLHDGVGSALSNIRLTSENSAVSRLAADALFELQNFLYDKQDYTINSKEFAAELRQYGNDFFDRSNMSFQMLTQLAENTRIESQTVV